jgi:hypothetical protein
MSWSAERADGGISGECGVWLRACGVWRGPGLELHLLALPSPACLAFNIFDGAYSPHASGFEFEFDLELASARTPTRSSPLDLLPFLCSFRSVGP